MPESKRSPKNPECCEPEHKTALQHSDHTEVLPRLNRVRGQLGGIEKMIDEGRYCVDILVQFRAAMAALRNIEVEIFERHLNHCVKSAILSKDKKEAQDKIQELTELLARRTSL